jgi:hypothetical protein
MCNKIKRKKAKMHTDGGAWSASHTKHSSPLETDPLILNKKLNEPKIKILIILLGIQLWLTS